MEASMIMTNPSDTEVDLGSIGFMFDASHARYKREFCIPSSGDTIVVSTIGEDPGHVQSGQYLWPAASFGANYITEDWKALQAPHVLELGAGCGLTGIAAGRLPNVETVTLTDYDNGSLGLLRENAAANIEGHVRVNVQFLEWGSGHYADIVIENGFGLILGSDLLYCSEVVRPLFKSVNDMMHTDGIFLLVSSFDPGRDVQQQVDAMVSELSLHVEDVISLDISSNICRVQKFRKR
jgi:predicted nicotinamide N-methyase